MAKSSLANVLSIHSEKKKYIAGHEDVENPRKNSRGREGLDDISGNVIMHVLYVSEDGSGVYTSHYGMRPRIT
jgi:hypothetical protein